ncbi:hypothetical protein J4P02_26865 [Pseudomonas sp. NFXW11]|uniref:hypothetical protein n=1 Tax=Pseudomonas sp. NFXW11 TaxID=2819531 RepID=UPI003CFB41E5
MDSSQLPPCSACDQPVAPSWISAQQQAVAINKPDPVGRHERARLKKAGGSRIITTSHSPKPEPATHGRLLLAAMLITPSLYASEQPPTDGHMYAVRYQQAKLACGSLPDDLEADYAKAMQLAKDASPEFAETYSKGLAAKPRGQKPATLEEQEAQCNEGQVSLRVTVKLARLWFPGGW